MLAVIGLADLAPQYLLAIAVIVMGATLVVESLLEASELSEVAARVSAGRVVKGGIESELGAEATAGGAALVLGILSLLSIHPIVLGSIAAIVLGAGFMLGSGVLARLGVLETHTTPEQGALRSAAPIASCAPVGQKVLVGLIAIILGPGDTRAGRAAQGGPGAGGAARARHLGAAERGRARQQAHEHHGGALRRVSAAHRGLFARCVAKGATTRRPRDGHRPRSLRGGAGHLAAPATRRALLRAHVLAARRRRAGDRLLPGELAGTLPGEVVQRGRGLQGAVSHACGGLEALRRMEARLAARRRGQAAEGAARARACAPLRAPLIPSTLMFKQELPLMFPDDAQVATVRSAMFDPFKCFAARNRDRLLKTGFKRPLGKVSLPSWPVLRPHPEHRPRD